METKTHIDKLRNPNYLGGWDLLDEHGKTIDKIVTIKEIKNESVFNQKDQSEQQVITIFFNDTATTEIYTSLFVGSVRCV